MERAGKGLKVVEISRFWFLVYIALTYFEFELYKHAYQANQAHQGTCLVAYGRNPGWFIGT